jgi:hypothetical protein
MSAVTLIREAAQERCLGWPERGQSGAQGAGQAARRAARQAESEQGRDCRTATAGSLCSTPGGIFEWLEAIADAKRLGYPPREDGR